MRELARFVQSAQAIDKSITKQEQLLHPKYYKICIEAVKHLGKFDNSTNLFSTPSVVLKAGHALKKCAAILKGTYISRSYDDGIKRIDQFNQLFETTCDVSAHALRSLSVRKWNKPTLLPLAEDMKKLYTFMKHKINLLKSELIEIPNRKIWNDLAKFTLAHVTFNRKCVGEVQRLTVEIYNSKCTSPVQEEVKACLSQMEVSYLSH